MRREGAAPQLGVAHVWLRRVQRHKGKCAAWTVGVLAAVLVATSLTPRWYRSEGAMYLRLGRENSALDSTAALGQTVVVPQGSREREVNTVLEMLKSRGQAEAVVDAFGPAAILRDAKGKEPGVESAPGLTVWLGLSTQLSLRERAVAHVIKQMDALAADDANLVWVAYEARDPEFAQRVVRKQIECYLERHAQFHRPSGSRSFLADHTAAMNASLQEAENKLRTTQEQRLLVAPSEQRAAMVTRMAKLETELAESVATERTLARRVDELRSMLATVPHSHVTTRTTGMPNEAADRMRDQLFTLQIREQALLAKYTTENVEVKSIRQQIQETMQILAGERELRTQQTEGVSQVHQQGTISLMELQPLLESQRARAVVLKEQLVAIRQELLKLSEDELDVARLRREVDLADAKYRKYTAGLDQAQLDEALDAQRISNVSIVQSPTFVAQPARPNLLLNLAVGLFAAAVGSLAVAYLAEHREARLAGVRERQQKHDAPMLAALSS